jgi:hypothetical protein
MKNLSTIYETETETESLADRTSGTASQFASTYKIGNCGFQWVGWH